MHYLGIIMMQLFFFFFSNLFHDSIKKMPPNNCTESTEAEILMTDRTKKASTDPNLWISDPKSKKELAIIEPERTGPNVFAMFPPILFD